MFDLDFKLSGNKKEAIHHQPLLPFIKSHYVDHFQFMKLAVL